MPFEDLLRNIRMNNIFAPTQAIPPTNPMQPQMPPQDPMEQYQPEHQMTDQLNQMISQFPTRNKPGALQKIAASIAGIGGGPQMADRFAYKPYYQNLQDWQAKIGPVERGAAEERMQNANMRQIAALLLRDKQAQERIGIQAGELGRKTEEGKAKIEQGQQKIDISKQRAATYDYKSRNPNHILREDADGYVYGTDPQTLKTQYLIDPDGNYVQGLSPAEKIRLGVEGQLKEIAARGAEARKTEGVRESGRQADISARGAQARETKISTNRAALAKDKELSVGQDAQAYKLARQQYIQDNPSHAKFWDNSGNPTGNAEKNDEYVSAVEDIRRRYNTIKARSGASSKQVTSSNPTPIRKEIPGHPGKFAVSNDGGKTWKAE